MGECGASQPDSHDEVVKVGEGEYVLDHLARFLLDHSRWSHAPPVDSRILMPQIALPLIRPPPKCVVASSA